MTLEQVAARLHCSVKTVRRRINAGELRASRIGRGVWEISDADLQAYLDAVATRPREVRPLPAAQPVDVPAGSAPAARRRRRRGSAPDGRLVITNDMGRHAA